MADRYLTEMKTSGFADKCPSPFYGMAFSILGAKIMRIYCLVTTERKGLGTRDGAVAQNFPDATSVAL